MIQSTRPSGSRLSQGLTQSPMGSPGSQEPLLAPSPLPGKGANVAVAPSPKNRPNTFQCKRLKPPATPKRCLPIRPGSLVPNRFIQKRSHRADDDGCEHPRSLSFTTVWFLYLGFSVGHPPEVSRLSTGGIPRRVAKGHCWPSAPYRVKERTSPLLPPLPGKGANVAAAPSPTG